MNNFIQQDCMELRNSDSKDKIKKKIILNSIHQRIKYFLSCFQQKILSSTSVFNIDNNKSVKSVSGAPN